MKCHVHNHTKLIYIQYNKLSEYDKEIAQSQTAEHPKAPLGSATGQSQ